MKKEELDIASEKIIFFMVLNYPEKVLKIPKGLYEKFMDHMLREEMYEDIPKLERLKDKVCDETLEELFLSYLER
jgi:hypothetical protein